MLKLTAKELIVLKEYVKSLELFKKEINVDTYILCKLSTLKSTSARRILKSLEEKQVLNVGRKKDNWQPIFKGINYRKALYTLRNN